MEDDSTTFFQKGWVFPIFYEMEYEGFFWDYIKCIFIIIIFSKAL